MTYARKSLVSLRQTPYYHVVSRCVRRAWLWGFDEYAGKDYSHRKDWVLERMALLDRVFAIDVCAYAVMSNHYHLVLHVDPAQAEAWSEQEVTRRWRRLFRVSDRVAAYVRGASTPHAEQLLARRMIAGWRARLSDISWYMRCLNENLARRANLEDGCKGRFWEGRFRSQALLDEAGLLTAMAYVDLNPIRAGIATTPESSEYTSIYERIRAIPAANNKQKPQIHVRLRGFHSLDAHRASQLPFALRDYLALVDWTGRAIRPDKRGHINQALPPLLNRLNIDGDAWRQTMRPSGNRFGRALGQLDHLRIHAHALGQQWVRGLRQCERLYRFG
jgi:REP element-mobilizing transposase RayT